MGTAVASSPAPVQRRKRRHNTVTKTRIGFFLLVVAAGFFSLAAAILLIVGMLPTMAAWFSDRDPQKIAGRTVGACNLAGIVPAILNVLPYGHNLEQTTLILREPFTWLIILASSALGWGILLGVPVVIKSMLAGKLHRKQSTIQRQQDTLVEEWGDKVTLAKPDLG